MKVSDVFKTASALLYENDGDSPDSKRFSPFFLNIFLQEALDTENSIRASAGETMLTAAQYVSGMDDVLTYHDSITRIALPYALASRFYAAEDDERNAERMRNEYRNALKSASKAVWGETENVYA